MKPTVVKIESEEMFVLTINGKQFPGFKKESEWNGCAKYVRKSTGDIVIVHTGGSTTMFNKLLDMAIDGELLLASPQIVMEINQA
jgi:hypothetical protein